MASKYCQSTSPPHESSHHAMSQTPFCLRLCGELYSAPRGNELWIGFSHFELCGFLQILVIGSGKESGLGAGTKARKHEF